MLFIFFGIMMFVWYLSPARYKKFRAGITTKTQQFMLTQFEKKKNLTNRTTVTETKIKGNSCLF